MHAGHLRGTSTSDVMCLYAILYASLLALCGSLVDDMTVLMGRSSLVIVGWYEAARQFIWTGSARDLRIAQVRGCRMRHRNDDDDVLAFFFFQAEDGIRDLTVTGVQTCALPI